MRFLRREDIRFLFLETAMILVGVLAALVVDGAREDAATRRAVEAATSRLAVEVQGNAQELNELFEVVGERVIRLRELRSDRYSGMSLAQIQSEFGGFRSPEFSSAAWDRLSRSALGEKADPDLLRDAFYLYEANTQLKSLDDQVKSLVFSELYFSPHRARLAIDIAERIMEQQLSWAGILLPRYEAFLSAHASDR